MPVLPEVGSISVRAGTDRARRLQGVDHADADAVLDARDRVEELELGQDVGLDAALLRQPVQAHERRVADGLGDRIVDAAAAGRAGGRRVGEFAGGVSHQRLLMTDMGLSTHTRAEMPVHTPQIVKSASAEHAAEGAPLVRLPAQLVEGDSRRAPRGRRRWRRRRAAPRPGRRGAIPAAASGPPRRVTLIAARTMSPAVMRRRSRASS